MNHSLDTLYMFAFKYDDDDDDDDLIINNK